MVGRIALLALLMWVPCLLLSTPARAQDVPGIEICTVEKTMERRTSCLQSNVDFLQKTIGKLTADHQQKLDAANRQIDSLKATVTGLQKAMDELQAAQKKTAEDLKKKVEVPAARDGAPPAKDGGK
jgi:peptidoglycan hydrolase CwlO-like protein